MTSFDLELEQQAKSSIRRAWPIAVGLVNTLQGLLVQNDSRYFNVVFGLLLVAVGCYYWLIYKPKLVSFDENGIAGKIRRGVFLDLKWDQISKLEGATFEINVYTKQGHKYEIDLSNITFREHKELKPKIFELARSKQIEVITS